MYRTRWGNNRYEIIKELGQGAFATAYLVRDTEDSRLKVLKRSRIRLQKPKEIAENEREILTRCEHDFIVKYYDSFEEDDYFFIVQEYCEGGDLMNKFISFSRVGKVLTEEEIIDWFSQLVSAIDYLHRNSILHRDIKSANIFIKNNQLKLGDFGLAKSIATESAFANTIAGTPINFSPEICNNQPYNSKSDVWTLGLILYEMCTYQLPFRTPTDVLKMEVPQVPRYSTNINKLIKKMLKKKYNERYSITEVKDFILEKFGSNPYLTPTTNLNKPKSASNTNLTKINGGSNTNLNRITSASSTNLLNVNDNNNNVTKKNNNFLGFDKLLDKLHVITEKFDNNLDHRKEAKTNQEYLSNVSVKVYGTLQRQQVSCMICKKSISNDEPYWKMTNTNSTGKELYYHEKCQKCKNCSKLVSADVIFKDNNMYCVECYGTMFSKKCFSCNKPIIGTYNYIESEAKRSSFRTWHPTCFKCEECYLPLTNEKLYLTSNKNKNSSIHCMKCYIKNHTKQCFVCYKAIVGSKCVVKSDKGEELYYHEDCQKCRRCCKPLPSKFFFKENNMYCNECHGVLYLPKCSSCYKPMADGSKYRLENGKEFYFHHDCHVCKRCNKAVTSGKFKFESTNMYCIDCYGLWFAKRCVGCRKPVVDDKYCALQATDDKIWHQSCFKCSKCATTLSAGKKVTRNRLDELVCSKCESK